ncbi:hypothetical protein A3G67_03215 [Candidatus Roizmanbacteria bacterium RIFCSPLOWO2_12_FULL_40_12]|uniref:Glycosyltransferase 2-like domain-containing protein n=1 Tax=Candidatus Roizmanbacteria bacterium RIFCSPLOWO2_01_FULL_40_42 TaxID=1802066 RepID=A0A1F7J5F1_9BACT|nr:MAG: hypothetical protein A2779_02850 [Candidatus Roizmanbacteria bacterium RIFCSPHIGHO2_01_FULL_40_98]OGK28280.1 MAG: hypothetical protein A3C31_00215 [Candidatus Roizmanbacteria bacterium RIFCSPHIGHO2_02_FULL_40_53]OGK30516.1 MAG: hypothetical protein A2W49_02900 [Candidatus Roizmanbacteria bacterium RIFCSPHIGHO2_12_41_18]OGK36930.1 MAG: hypothetical protein A3E69_00475 [Candidatus Roizmanbacteria bacterium RIFCSPHIGHO2_12_FULL_40_130]OGK50836.1 MAG: hypothetical protein A3B50_00985 [Candi
MAKNLFVSVVVPVKALSYYLLHENLPELFRQTYKNYEVLVLPNNPSLYDITLLKRYKKLRIIPTGKITRPAQKRDIGVKESKGKIIAFLDDDAYPDPHWLENAAKSFKGKKTLAVCGPGAIPKEVNLWEKIFDEVLKTWIGSGGFTYRFTPGKKRYVDDYPSMNFIILKKTFLKLGGFNSDYWPGEDSKLCNDLIVKEKGRILYDPSILVYHHRRNKLKGFLKQHANYGFHRGAFFAHGDKNSRDVAYLAPTFFILYLIALVLYYFAISLLKLPNSKVFLLPFAPAVAYGLLMSHLFVKSIFNTRNPIIGLGAMGVLILTHVTYGIMFIKGYRKGIDKTQSIYD